ncbi:sterol desaturase family protein [Brevundimonas sp.]|uniref:sterol desaturase family protein n=1 Tax=Brevundimonas sp. TaxID=1871086 RepID=UPI002D35615D|nr:sterol desaturase family protein [Brevundimonas sp.]HYC97798.1 sterol desaturase family protein [Brevundimonas sp.]
MRRLMSQGGAFYHFGLPGSALARLKMINVVTVSILAMFVGFILLDTFWRPRRYPSSPWWRLRGVGAFMVYMTIALFAPLLWDAFLAEHRLLDLTAQPLWLQLGAGFVMYQLTMYLWHRSLHGVDFLWRHLHQTHHSAERVDVWGAFWFHPLDMVAWTLQGSLALVWIVGISVEAVIPIVLLNSFMGMFTHANVRTPRWLGWIVARPEMHAAHHERGVHRSNYCDLPLIDMMFGTWNNPKTAPKEAGFYDGASAELGALLVGKTLA